MSGRTIARNARKGYDGPTIAKTHRWSGPLPQDRIPAENRKDLNRELIIAARKGDAKRIRKILGNGVDINACNDSGWTALMVTSGMDCIETTRILIEHGADVNAKDKTGWTALHWAAFFGKTETAGLLLEKGAPLDLKDKRERTPLKLTSLYGHDETAALLRKHGAAE